MLDLKKEVIFIKISDLVYVSSCNVQKLYGKDTGSLRPDGRSDYHILYITKGSCFVNLNGEICEAKEGSIILYLPHEYQEYTYKKNIKTTSYFVHFQGSILENLFKDYTERIIYIGKNTKIERLFENLVEEYHLKMMEYEEICASLLLTIISYITREKNCISKNSNISSNEKIAEACAQINSNIDKTFLISDYAEMYNMSESRFSHLFKLMTGTSPNKYVNEMRIEKAKEMLINTNFLICEIAQSVGMQSQSYFCKVFKKYTLYSPIEYRELFK